MDRCWTTLRSTVRKNTIETRDAKRISTHIQYLSRYPSQISSSKFNIRSYSITSDLNHPPSQDQSLNSSSKSQSNSNSLSQTFRAEKSMQRFWKNVDIHQSEENGQYSIRLDGRNLKTPNGNPLVLSKSKLPLMVLIAREWDQQTKILKQHSLPLTSLVSRAIDGMNESERESIVDGLMSYLDTDTICFHQSEPTVLVKMQKTHWDPLIKWIQETYRIDLKVHHDSILFSKQTESTKSKLKNLIMKFDQLKLAAFERAVHVSKSFIIALALVQDQITVEEASEASRVEVLAQITRWGEVEDTHDVDYQEIRMKLGSVACSLIDLSP